MHPVKRARQAQQSCGLPSLTVAFQALTNQKTKWAAVQPAAFFTVRAQQSAQAYWFKPNAG